MLSSRLLNKFPIDDKVLDPAHEHLSTSQVEEAALVRLDHLQILWILQHSLEGGGRWDDKLHQRVVPRDGEVQATRDCPCDERMRRRRRRRFFSILLIGAGRGSERLRYMVLSGQRKRSGERRVEWSQRRREEQRRT